MLGPLIYLIDIELPFFKKAKEKKKKAKSEQPGLTTKTSDAEQYRLKAAIYKTILERYKDEIEMHEKKTLAELKGLIDPTSSSINQVKELILSNFHPYIYEKDFLSAAEMAYEFVKNEIRPEVLPIEFWLTLDEMFNLKAGDNVDKARFLCSLLLALNNPEAKVIVENSGKAFVSFTFNQIYYVINVGTNERLFGQREEVLSGLKNKYKLVYEFNNFAYEEY